MLFTLPRTLLLCLAALACESSVEPAPILHQPGADSILAIRNARIITMQNDDVLTGHTVLVQGDRIAALGPAASSTCPPGQPSSMRAAATCCPV